MNWLRRSTSLGLLVSAFVLSGCDFKEIDSINTVLAIGIDQSDNGKILLTIEIPDYSKSKSKQMKSMTITGTGATIEEAERSIQLRNPKELYLAHTSLILLGSRYAHHNISGLIDFIQRIRFFRPTLCVAVCQGSVEKMLGAEINSESINALGLCEIVNQGCILSRTTSTDMTHFVRDLHHHSQTFSLVAFKMSAKGEPEVSGEGLFQKKRLMRWISTKEAPFLKLLTQRRIKSMSLSIHGSDQMLVGRVLWASTSTKIHMENGKLTVVYKVKGEGQIDESSQETMFTSEELAGIERKMDQALKEKTGKLIKSLQEAKVDGIDLADELFREHPKLYRKLSQDWDAEFAKADISCEFDIHLIRTGLKK